jgi:hypothetical protein
MSVGVRMIAQKMFFNVAMFCALNGTLLLLSDVLITD